MRRRSSVRFRAAAIGVTVLLGLTACSATPAATTPVVSVPEPLPSAPVVPPGTAAPSPVTSHLSSCPSGSPGSDPIASWRPPATMPEPGDMPSDTAMRKIQQRGYLIAGVDQDEYQVSYRNLSPSPSAPSSSSPTGGDTYQLYKGFDVDILHAIAAAVFGPRGADRIKYVPVTQDFRLGAANHGIVDVVADSVTITCQRWQYVDFSTDYLDAAQRLLVNADNKKADVSLDDKRVPHIEGLRGGKICTVGSTTSINNLTALERTGDFRVVDATDWSDCIMLLQRGAVQAMSTDDTVLQGLQAQDPYLKVVGQRFSYEPHGLIFPNTDPYSHRNSQFVAFANGVIAGLERRGSDEGCPEPMTSTDRSCWAAIYRTWLGPQPPSPPVPEYAP
ncbi:transporter substrate-binding domain-containing protein [Streptantibioticus silvisoli]|uniref:Transporter substrate-binding domain-containing protein n=1 Tax=Streptantibioticus silvisoli TaxID=2705255 RepID=A0ABT6VYY1_9ACTN|nr:transporter substrate-binding domain-containing protein [Streptantibioticus silvisoli]MDI5963370.1 transporter substrate-binding domain-containing protein [Streptantibioticus silvisoli]